MRLRSPPQSALVTTAQTEPDSNPAFDETGEAPEIRDAPVDTPAFPILIIQVFDVNR